MYTDKTFFAVIDYLMSIMIAICLTCKKIYIHTVHHILDKKQLAYGFFLQEKRFDQIKALF